MKKTILTVATFTFIVGSLLTSCNSPAKKVENAEEKVIEADKELDKANQEYYADMEAYKKEMHERIEANEKSIAECHSKMEHKKKEEKEEYKKKISELEERNNNMRKKIDEYKADGKEKWNSFKAEFSHDMDELGKAFKDLTVDNVK